MYALAVVVHSASNLVIKSFIINSLDEVADKVKLSETEMIEYDLNILRTDYVVTGIEDNVIMTSKDSADG